MPDIDEDTVDIRPWPIAELVGRAVVLATVARRGMIDLDEDRDLFEMEADQFDLSAWGRTELQGWLSARDVELLTRPAGEMNENDLAACEEALIGASTIAWALRAVDAPELPVPQDGSAEHATLEWAPEPWEKVQSLRQRARLRSDEDLGRERERWELWYWRTTDAEGDSEALADVVAEIEDAGLIPIVLGDFATAAGEPFSQVSQSAKDDIAWLAEIRLRTMNWICGFGHDWNSAPLYIDE
ncbi:MAG TPA: hypothetical protein VNZ58_11510 [Thermomicrobiales bacterium]|nr:hypothetical protein [Thermomicrobiales bacterium]